MSGAVEALRHLELMALNTAQTAAAASKVNECVALLTASLTTPPARSYADGIADAAKVCDERAAGRLRLYEDNQAEINAFKAAEAEDAAAAIRLLSQGGKA